MLVRDIADLAALVTALDGTEIVSLDLETTGLDTRHDRIRLLSLDVDAISGGRFRYLVDCFAVVPALLWHVLAQKELLLHHAAFDLAFLARLGFTPAKVNDTMLMAQLLVAGSYDRVNLAACCERWLNRTLDKAEQKSDWTGPLTAEQIAYAAADVEVLLPLFQKLSSEVKAAGLDKVADLERRCLPAIVWMDQHGVAFDKNAWRQLAQAANEEADRLRMELDYLAPSRPGTFEGMASWNWDSPAQVQEALSLAGYAVQDTADETLASVDLPLAALVRQYREVSKRASTYGKDWLKHLQDNGRVYPSWRQIGSRSGRMSCTEPNMQNLPRGEHRRCVIAPPGRVLVKADYSQIELRIAAKVSGDKALLDAYQRGEDLHTRTARAVLGSAEVSKQDRQLAKALNFGLLYGMGGKTFRLYAKCNYGLDLTEEQAQQYRAAFFRSYPGLVAWHRRVGKSGKQTIDTRTLTGRWRLEVKSFMEKLNTPVQGTGADGLKLALALLWERRHEVPGAFLVLAVHDEIVVEAGMEQADVVAVWLKQAMLDAMAPLVAPVPVVVGVTKSQNWGED
jgi:DNA polymerase-1